MKSIIAVLFFMSLFLIATAQKPEPVYGFARISHPMEWYKNQSVAWKNELKKNPNNAIGWYYYYYAKRILAFNDKEDKRTSKERLDEIDQLINNMGKAIPNSYEYNLCKWMAGGLDIKLLPYLNKAIELGENRTEHLDFLINIGETDRNIKKRDTACLKKFNAGLISTGLMYYNYNVLIGLKPNAILITWGDNDTYPIWVLQAQGIRKDVTVTNMYLLALDDYRAKIFTELKIPMYDSITPNSWKQNSIELIKHMAIHHNSHPLYLGLTVCDEFVQPMADSFYVTGLAYEFSVEKIDNIALLKRNFEQKYALDNLDKAFYNDISTSIVSRINQNYIVPMIKLYEHYKASNDKEKEDWIKHKIISIANKADEEDKSEILKYLQQH